MYGWAEAKLSQCGTAVWFLLLEKCVSSADAIAIIQVLIIYDYYSFYNAWESQELEVCVALSDGGMHCIALHMDVHDCTTR